MDECSVDVKRVLAALDLSAFSETCFTHALTLARSMNAELIILNVINDRGLEALDRLAADAFGVSREKYIETVQAERKAEIENNFISRASGVRTRLIFRVGLPYEQILKAIEKEDVDMVVLATKGRTNLAGALFGTTAEKVFRRAPCTVVSVRGPEHCRLPG